MANFIIEKTPVIEATPDYSTGDIIGGKQSAVDARFTGNSVVRLRRVVICDKAAQGISMDVVLFNADPSGTTFTENGAAAIAAADAAKIITAVPVTVHVVTGAASKVSESAALDIPITLAASTLYFCAIIRGTGNYAAVDDLTFKLVFSS